MLVDQNYADIFSLCGKPLKGLLNRGVVRLAVYNKEVLLGIWGRRDMLPSYVRPSFRVVCL